MKFELYCYDLLNKRGVKIDELMFRIKPEVGTVDELWGYRGRATTKIKVINNKEVQLV